MTRFNKFPRESDVVMAIDLGTTTVKYGYIIDNSSILLDADIKDYISDNITSSFQMSPAVILFKPDMTFDSFGYEAERKYSELIFQKEHQSWFYFERFKLELFKIKNVNRGLKIADTLGKLFPARIVFSEMIRYLKSSILDQLDAKGLSINDIHCVLSIPDSWEEMQRQFIKETAILAGFHDECLSLVEDSEAITLYCKSLPEHHYLHKNDNNGEEKICHSFMVLSLGGGKSASLIYNMSSDGNITIRNSREIINGEGVQVDVAFLSFLLNVVPSDVWLKFKERHLDDYNEIFQKFETQKQKFSQHTIGSLTIDIPFSLLEILRKEKGTNLEDIVNNSKIESKFIRVVKRNLEILASRVRQFYNEVGEAITLHVQSEFTKHGSTDIIFLIGGFSNSAILQYLLRNTFPDKNVIVPINAEFAELRGLLMTTNGHQEKINPEHYLTYTDARMMRRSNPFIKEDKSPKPLEVYAVIDIGSTYSGCAYALSSDCTNGPLPVVTTVKWIGGNDIFWPKTPTTLLLKVIEVKPIIPHKDPGNSIIKQNSGKKKSLRNRLSVSFDDDYYEVLEIDDETQRYDSGPSRRNGSYDSDSTPEDDRDVVAHIPEEKLEERSKIELDKENFLFGFEAEDEHYKFEDPNTYRYFPKFLTQITSLTSDSKVKDSCGAEMLASELYYLVILALKRKIEHIVFYNRRLPVRKHNFKWILTVPSTWNNEALEVISEAAKKAGLIDNQFRLVPELTAVSMYCNLVFEEDVKKIRRNEDILILDLGGGHIDTAVLVCDGIKRHLVCSREAISGDTIIESGVQKYLTKEFGHKSMKQICKSADYLRTLRSFNKTLDSVSRINSTPRIFVPPMVRQSNAQTDKLMIPSDEFASIFYSYIDQIVEHIESLLNNDVSDDRRIGAIFIVGGLSVTHRQIKEGLTEAIQEIRVCVPSEAVTCAMIGGIMCCYRNEFGTYNVIHSDSIPEPESNEISGNENLNSVTNGETRHIPPPSYSSIGRRSGKRNRREGSSHSRSSRVHSSATTPSFEDPPSYSSVGQASGFDGVHKKGDNLSVPDIEHHGHGAFSSQTTLKIASDRNAVRHHPLITRTGSHSSVRSNRSNRNDASNTSSPQIRHRSRVHPRSAHRTANQSNSRQVSNDIQNSDHIQSSCCHIL